MYNPSGLDEERLSWRTVIFFNIARPVRRILDVLDAYGDGEDDEEYASNDPTGTPRIAVIPELPEDQPASSSQESLERKVAHLRLRLSPLLAAEASLAERLSGGIDVSGSGSLLDDDVVRSS